MTAKNLHRIPNRNDYWKHPEEGFPKTVKWVVVAGERELSSLEDHDIVFDRFDLRIRGLL